MKLRSSGKKFVELKRELSDKINEDDERKYLIERETNLDELSNALSQLNLEQQQCISMFYLQKRSYLEITELTNYTVMQVKSNIQNGKRNLKLILQKVMQKD